MRTNVRNREGEQVRASATPGRERVRVVMEARVTAVLESGRARIMTSAGRALDGRCAHSVDLGWLRAAVAIGPVDAEASVSDDGAASVWAVFPGPEHACVAPERIAMHATERVRIMCGKSTLELRRDGTVQVRGRDVVARGSRVTRVQGGAVRLG